MPDILAKLKQLQDEELALDKSLRDFYEPLFRDFREQLQRQFLSHFVVQRGAPTQRWRGNPADIEPLVTSFEELTAAAGDEVNATLDDETQEALEDGYETMVLWLPELGIDGRDETQSYPAPWLLAATAALGLTHRARVDAWNEVHRAKMTQSLRTLNVGSATLPETLQVADSIMTGLERRIRALAGNERFRAFWVGADYAAQPFEDRIQWRWFTRRDEATCREQPAPLRACRPLHGTITTLIPVQDTHPGCRCWREPEPRAAG